MNGDRSPGWTRLIQAPRARRWVLATWLAVTAAAAVSAIAGFRIDNSVGIWFEADDPALAGGLEFSQYAGDVAQHMKELGYAEAASPEDATLLVRFDYGVDDGRERVVSSPFSYGYRDPFYRGWYDYQPIFFRDRDGNPVVTYVPVRRWNYGFYDPWFGGPDIDSYTVYTSGISLKIDRASDGKRLFEGKAQAVSTSNRLQYLVPNLVEAMFTGFPGDNGKTVRISIAPEDQPVKRK